MEVINIMAPTNVYEIADAFEVPLLMDLLTVLTNAYKVVDGEFRSEMSRFMRFAELFKGESVQ